MSVREYMDSFQERKNGNKDAILEGLQSSAALIRINAVTYAVKQGLSDSEVKETLLALKGDREACMGYRILLLLFWIYIEFRDMRIRTAEYAK